MTNIIEHKKWLASVISAQELVLWNDIFVRPVQLNGDHCVVKYRDNVPYGEWNRIEVPIDSLKPNGLIFKGTPEKITFEDIKPNKPNASNNKEFAPFKSPIYWYIVDKFKGRIWTGGGFCVLTKTGPITYAGRRYDSHRGAAGALTRLSKSPRARDLSLSLATVEEMLKLGYNWSDGENGHVKVQGQQLSPGEPGIEDIYPTQLIQGKIDGLTEKLRIARKIEHEEYLNCIAINARREEVNKQMATAVEKLEKAHQNIREILLDNPYIEFKESA